MIPVEELRHLHMDPPKPVPGAGDGMNLVDVTPETIDALVEVAGPGSGSPLLCVELRQLGGAVAETSPDHGAVGTLDAGFAMFGVGMAVNAEMRTRHRGAGRGPQGRARPLGGRPRVLQLRRPPPGRRGALPGGDLPRPGGGQGRVDPEELFRATHPIRPASRPSCPSSPPPPTGRPALERAFRLPCPDAPDARPPRDAPPRDRRPPRPRRADARRRGRARRRSRTRRGRGRTRSSRCRFPAEEVVAGLDAVIVTHLHQDHFDETGARLVPRDVPVFCQPEDEERLRDLGLDARPVEDELDWDGLRIARTGGRHGADEATVARRSRRSAASCSAASTSPATRSGAARSRRRSSATARASPS